MSIPDMWVQAEDLFHEVAALGGAERAARLAVLRQRDPGLYAEVASLLRADAAASRVLGRFEALAGRPSPESLPEPVQIDGGPYRLQREIGRGGMGVVYLAWDERLDRPVALKFLPRPLSADPVAKARLIAEAKAAAGLDHPNIATVYEIGETGDRQLYIAMAYYEGRTLKARIAEGPLPSGEALEIACGVGLGLEAAHACGVVHRDVKPANVLLTRSGGVKLLDFGIATRGSLERAEAAARMGTLAYMAPEQARGEAVDVRADVWALGVVLYEMLTGRKPFRGDEAAVLHALQHEPPDPPSRHVVGLPEGIEGLLGRALAKDRETRYPDVTSLLADLRRLQQPAAAPAGAPEAPPAGAGVAGTLPVPLSRFVGRGPEIEEVRRLLGKTRLLTLTGPGGTGKTRLSLEVAQAVRGAFAHGVHFVSLAALSDPGLVASTVAKALGLREAGGQSIRDSLRAFLREREVLLILDNFEQILPAADLVAELLRSCPGLRVLVTSRASLHLSGEREYPVPPLRLPGASAARTVQESEAVELFVERARAIRPDLSLGDEQLAVIAEICVRLDGLPLAIELAAARSKVLSPRAILARLQHRFQLLTGGARDLPPRHQALRETIGWSYDLLDKEERKLLRRVSAFVGGHTLEAVEAVCRAVEPPAPNALEGLSSLVDKSLLRQEEQADGEPRFSMLESIREFGLECLRASGEEEEVRRAHGRYFLHLCEEAEPHLTGPQQAVWLDRLEQEHDNLRAALAWIREAGEDREAGARFGAALWRLWLVRGYLREGRERLGDLAAWVGEAAPAGVRARLHTGIGTLAHNLGDYAAARRHYEESLALYQALEDRPGIADTLNDLGWMAWRLGDFAAARTLSEEALALHRSLANRRGVALALNNLGWVAHHQGDYAAARALHEESLALRRALGDKRGTAFALNNLGWAVNRCGDHTRAQGYVEEALRLFREVGERQLLAFGTSVLAEIVHHRGDAARARSLLEETSLPLFREIGDRYGMAFALGALGAVVGRADPERALARCRESLAIRQEIEDRWGVALVLQQIGDLVRPERPEEAAACYRQSLRLRAEMEDADGVAACLLGLAEVAGPGAPERAATLLGAAGAIRAARGVSMHAAEEDLLPARSGAAPCSPAAWAAALAAGRAMGLQEAVAYALAEGTASSESL